jgi:protein TonB
VPIVPPPLIAKAEPKTYILLTKEEYETFDLSKPGPSRLGPANATQLASASAGGGDSRAVGTAPDGQPLYDAQWYRHPTDAQMGMYLPKQMPSGGGWGLIACKTVARYHVDDCVELGSYPAGSHLASAVRQAAWQFLVRPPRRGGQELVGTWVRIRIDYGTKFIAAPDASGADQDGGGG